MKFSSVLSIAIVLVLGTTAAAQFVSATVSPSPTTPGSYVQGSVETNVPAYLATSGCGIEEVKQGSPTGPQVWQPGPCTMQLIPVGPGNPWSIVSVGNVIANSFNEPSNPAAATRRRRSTKVASAINVVTDVNGCTSSRR